MWSHVTDGIHVWFHGVARGSTRLYRSVGSGQRTRTQRTLSTEQRRQELCTDGRYDRRFREIFRSGIRFYGWSDDALANISASALALRNSPSAPARARLQAS